MVRSERSRRLIERKGSAPCSHFWPPEGGWETRASHSSSRLHQISYANQVVSCRGEGEHPVDQTQAAVPELIEQPDGLHPSEWFFDELPLSLAHFIAIVARSLSLQGGI